jgi:hypothetical protein
VSTKLVLVASGSPARTRVAAPSKGPRAGGRGLDEVDALLVRLYALQRHRFVARRARRAGDQIHGDRDCGGVLDQAPFTHCIDAQIHQLRVLSNSTRIEARVWSRRSRSSRMRRGSILCFLWEQKMSELWIAE